MEIRPDRFKVAAAKTLGKIYGYVNAYHGQKKNEGVIIFNRAK